MPSRQTNHQQVSTVRTTVNINVIKNTLASTFGNLEEVAPNIFCATEKYDDTPFAIRYFDLNNKIIDYRNGLDEYLENILGEKYYDSDNPIDLRWNNYLYFITSNDANITDQFKEAKSVIESDREYARKFVFTEDKLNQHLKRTSKHVEKNNTSNLDLFNTWLNILNEKGLGYILDFNLKAPEIVRKICRGDRSELEQIAPVGELNPSEKAAVGHPIKTLRKSGFREHPTENEFSFGSRVNLIAGPNGHGKTSLLETIEYLYCGSTFRNGEPNIETSVSASLFMTDEQLETFSNPKDAARLKSRNLGWFGKNDLRGNSLPGSFSRFNFMDTDAAVRISVEDTTEQLSQDISRIILGAEASKASDQIERTDNELEKRIKATKNEEFILKTKINQFKDELKTLDLMTKNSDTYFHQLKTILQEISWIDKPDTISEPVINSLLEQMNFAYQQCKVLEGSSVSKLRDQYALLDSSRKFLSEITATLFRTNSEIIDLSSEKDLAAHKLKCVADLRSYTGLKLLELEKLKDDLSASINNIKYGLPNLNSFELIRSDLLDSILSKASTTVSVDLNNQTDLKSNLKNKILEHERSQTDQTNLLGQLISTANKILSQSPDKDHCPLCHTNFNEGQLLLSITKKSKEDGQFQSNLLRENLNTIEDTEESLLKIRSALSSLIKYCGDAASNLTVKSAIEIIKKDHRTLLTESQEVKDIEEKINAHNRNGLSTSKLNELLRSIGTDAYSKEKIAFLSNDLNTKVIEIENEIASRRSLQKDQNKRISEISVSNGKPESLSASELICSVEQDIIQCEQRIFAKDQLTKLIGNTSNFSPSSLLHQIDSARETTLKVHTSYKNESESNLRTVLLNKQVDVNSDLLKDTEIMLAHLKFSITAVSGLLTGDNSLETIKNKILSENALIISEIFSKIHFPNEYEISIKNSEIKLIHKITKESRTLKEVSTGQRAAFALSLFMTMNKTLKSGPKVLLLDDPISHIDDINMLSFLDYLRELSIEGDRQIFFATPNTKLANLFQHKFNFLNDTEFKKIQLSR